ncbi:MAG: UDP-GlcNAc--UDP-phosphate GlcNAc-1-phosphate transferase [Sphingobacteriales bacterium 17-39-43]|uniref:MraY family glycosyltransferase n=1 Tax=Daejeonella sp. TaxID=2805397 RepID=UPI000BCE64E8|nr:glycosyltransferase family 4 protein [Daejeonella sp.]OYZ30210.1 MAG: UDP-GlcNAc--UDP-phosphate GlcNAc-1-phosphate transferase [Sphingobacteriales bacterium 16-39-50]OZA22953.1 MAG: UDP-GlcNAc--UDP-phosphate GlcNAc-1-phosphate transferase [Sphingobacteriales bacterium 17-39-43]HQT24153.1 glycosyltransferase family 4 protein [Daejeonella sp.]HQT58763.1 glycosyltransferase family 4 protein [Daejeonella sp.]
MLYLLYLPILTFLILVYFRLAIQFKIIDKPNQRSSHSRITIRGGGIVFPIAVLIHALVSNFQYPLFTSGLMLISFVSFYDDLRPLSNKIRLFVHLIAVSFLFSQTNLLIFPIWIVIPVYILVIGTINAYNFMDGINGITGSYSLITILSLYFINEFSIPFVSSELLTASSLALIVFNFFNFRKKAKCFAGDVGSVSMAFIIIFFLLLLILKTGDLKYIGLLLFYGLDTVSTIIFRLIRRENIFEAHRSHFYQYLANVKGWPHLRVSALYMVVQLLVNLLIILCDWNFDGFLIFILVSGIVFVGLRFVVEGRGNLIMSKLAN